MESIKEIFISNNGSFPGLHHEMWWQQTRLNAALSINCDHRAPMLIVHSHNGRVDILFVLSFDIWRSAAHDVF